MKNKKSFLIFLISFPIFTFSQGIEVIRSENLSYICSSTFQYEDNVSAPNGMNSYLWSNGSKNQTTKLWDSIPGLHHIWCIINDKDTLKRSIWLVPIIHGPVYLKKNEDSIVFPTNDTFVLNGTLKCFWFRDGVEVEGEHLYYILPKESGKYTMKVENPCSLGGFYRALGSVNFQVITDIENNSLGNFKIFPNPTQDIINISLPDGKYSVAILNAIGQVLETSEEIGSFQKNLSNLHSGFYFLRINSKIVKIQKK